MNSEEYARIGILVKDQGEQIIRLCIRVEELEKENEALRRRLNKDSSNSSKPPSSDSIFKRPERKPRGKRRNKSGKKPGGQIGHKGNKLTKFETVDHKEDHALDHCPCCQSKDLNLIKTRVHQVLDIPLPKLEVTEHTSYNYTCGGCGEQVSSAIAQELKQEVQYGPKIKALVNYLSIYQLIPFKRLTELIEDIYGQRISQGSISNFNKEMSDKLDGFVDQVKSTLSKVGQVVHGDETGCMVSKILHWVHVYSDKTRTFLQGHAKRGHEAMDAIGVLIMLQGVLIHDRYRSYEKYVHLEHGLSQRDPFGV